MKFNHKALFYIYLYLNVFCKGIGLDNSSKLYLILIVLGAIAVALKIMKDSFTRKEFIFISISLLVGIANFVLTLKPTLMLTCICLIGLKNIDINKMFKNILNIRVFTFILTIFLSSIGIMNNVVSNVWKTDHLVTRYSLGYLHSNTLHLSLFLIVSLIIYIYFDKIKVKHYLLIMLVNIIIYRYSICRTGFIAIVMLLFLHFIVKNNQIIKKNISKVVLPLLLIVIFVSFFSGLMYNKIELVNKLNSIVTGRIAYSNYYLTNYSASLFGHNISNDTNAIIDNGYILLYIQYGIVGSLYVLYIIYRIVKNIKINLDYKKAVLIIMFLLYVLTESFLPNIFMNFTLLFCADIFFNNKAISNEV